MDHLGDPLVAEIDRALRPVIHERRVPSSGTILAPSSDPAGWEHATGLRIGRIPLDGTSAADARRYADGLSSWLFHGPDGVDTLLMFDRPVGSERDLVVVARALGATIVQRHPSGVVRIVGAAGVFRWDGFSWHHEPPVTEWIDLLSCCSVWGATDVLRSLLEFAVHDLGAMRIGALLIYRPPSDDGAVGEERLAVPPALCVTEPFHLAPIRQSLSQIDGAAVFDADGVLRQLGVRVVPSQAAEDGVDPLGGMRHTSGRRYSYDDPTATVIVVSEDGPVTALRNGVLLGRSPD